MRVCKEHRHVNEVKRVNIISIEIQLIYYNPHYCAYCPHSVGKWTIKFPAKIIIAVIPQEFRQFWIFDSIVEFLIEFGKNSKFYQKFDIGEIQVAKFLLPNFRFTLSQTVTDISTCCSLDLVRDRD
jgi:hypothetical protein